MKTSTLLTSMLAGVAACALSTAPALAAPNIHLSAITKAPLRLNSGAMHVKTDTNVRAPHNASTIVTTLDISGTLSSGFSGLLYAYTWYTKTSGGKCVQPKKQKQAYKKVKNGTVVPATTKSTNPCGTGTFKYYGPDYTAGAAGKSSFRGSLKAKNFYGDNLTLNEVVKLKIT